LAEQILILNLISKLILTEKSLNQSHYYLRQAYFKEFIKMILQNHRVGKTEQHGDLPFYICAGSIAPVCQCQHRRRTAAFAILGMTLIFV
jgi:hypothetical protein